MLNLQVCTGARISRNFAAIVQESGSFRQIRASPFSVFIFDFRMKRKWGNKRWRLERSAAWYSRGIPPDQAWQSYQPSLQTLVRRRCVDGYPGRIFYCCIQRNKWSFHLRWQVPPNLVLCPASAGKNPENVGGFGGLLLWLRDLWYPQELNFQERTLSLLSRLQHWRMDSQFRVLHSHKHYFHEPWTIASK